MKKKRPLIFRQWSNDICFTWIYRICFASFKDDTCTKPIQFYTTKRMAVMAIKGKCFAIGHSFGMPWS